jgi:hypothetical protein
MSTVTESELERQVREQQEQHQADEVAERRARAEGTDSGEDPDSGKIFDVPRVKVLVDESDPSVLKVAFSGSIELERGNQAQMDFYNRLRHGKEIDFAGTGFVAGAKKTHRRDSEGDVDAIVETKTVIVTDVHITD